MTEATAIILAALLTAFGAYCIARQFARDRKRPGFPQYETHGDVVHLPRHEGNIVRFERPSKGAHRPIL